MATTALFVEILVIGATTELWLVALLLSFVPIGQLAVLLPGEELLSIVAVFALALTYALGWAINFAAEQVFWLFRQTRFRDALFKDKIEDYEKARLLVHQKGSAELIEEIHMDRHILRIARGNAFNFIILAFTLLFGQPFGKHPVVIPSVISCFLIAILSFLQWLRRYRAHYKRMVLAVDVVKENPV